MSVEDIKNIHIAEDAFEIYYNKGLFKRSINYILNNIDNGFNFFYNLGLHYPRNLELKDNNMVI